MIKKKDLSEYFSKIGKKGGSQTSEKKKLANKKNIAKRWAKKEKKK